MYKIIKVMFLVLLPSFIMAQPKFEGIKIEETSKSHIMEFSLPKIKYEKKIVESINRTFLNLNINEEFGIIDEKGLPELPMLTFDFEIPDNMDKPVIEIIESNKVKKKIDFEVYPYQEAISKAEEGSEPKFNYDELFYQTEGKKYDLVSVSESYIISGRKGVKITISPINYNPKKNELEVTDYVKVEIKSGKTDNKSNSVGFAFDNFFSKHFVNYKKSDYKDIQYGNFLIITAPEFETTVNYFAVYKRNRGYNITVANTGTIGSSGNSIKNYIQTRYNNTSTRPDFVLLVGDTDRIPCWVGEGDDNPNTDLNYSNLEGNDKFPDVFLGRFSVRNDDHLRNIIRKTILMESNVQTFNKNAVFPADDDFWGYFIAGHEWVIDNTFEPEAYNCLKLYDGEGATSQDLINAINNGKRFCLYSGHGSTAGFSAPGFESSNVTNLHNTIYPFGYAFACYTNNFAVDQTFGETWVRSNHGGVSYYGSSHTTWYRDDKILEKKVFGDAFTEKDQTAPMFNIGMQRYWNSWTTIGKRQKKYIEQYNLIGDPSLIVIGTNNNCFSDYIFDLDIVFQDGSDISVNADQTIVAAENNSIFVAEAGSDVTLKANGSIVLKPGFRAEEGCFLKINIGPCSDQKYADNQDKQNDIDIENLNEENTLIEEIVYTKPAIYPNPNNGLFYVDIEDYSNCKKIEITNIMGRVVEVANQINRHNTFNLENLDVGLYLIHIYLEQGVIVKKIIKQ